MKIATAALLTFVAVAPLAEAQNALTSERLEAWLTEYGAAWEGRDADAAQALFAPDARYYETPYAEPFLGRAAIGGYWANVTSDQSGIDFEAAVVAVSGNTGVARWSARFRSISGDVPVELNGVFVLEFDEAGRCTVLREWWHAR